MAVRIYQFVPVYTWWAWLAVFCTHSGSGHACGRITCVEGRTNLDTQAWYTGRLVIGVFDDEVAGGPVSLLEVRGEPVESKKKKSELEHDS